MVGYGSMIVRRPHSLNIFSSETTGPIKVKFHMERLWDWGTKVCSNGPGHVTKMAAMSIYGKNLLKVFFFGTKRLMTLKLGMHHRVLKFAQMMTLGWPFTARSTLVPYAFCMGKKDKTMHFSETIVVYDLKLATDDRSDKKFLMTTKLCPLGAVCPLPWGYIH